MSVGGKMEEATNWMGRHNGARMATIWRNIDISFYRPDLRQSFLEKAAELLQGRWEELDQNGNNPASRQRTPH